MITNSQSYTDTAWINDADIWTRLSLKRLLQKVEQQQHHHIHCNNATEPAQNPGAQGTSAAGKEQSIAHIDYDVAHDSLHTTSHNDQRRYLAGAL